VQRLQSPVNWLVVDHVVVYAFPLQLQKHQILFNKTISAQHPSLQASTEYTVICLTVCCHSSQLHLPIFSTSSIIVIVITVIIIISFIPKTSKIKTADSA